VTSAAPLPARAARRSRALAVVAAFLLAVVVVLLGAAAGHAGELDPAVPAPTAPSAPADPTAPTPPGSDDGLSVQINGVDGAPSSAVLTLIGITLLSVAPALLLMMTSFTKIFVVLAMTRNALSLPSIPPNQVLAGLALFLSLFIMAPVLTEINDLAVQPYLDGHSPTAPGRCRPS
jgi:flagellar biosynthetic protein FliP